MPRSTCIDELRKKQTALAARIKAEEAKLASRSRKADTRRKVLAGAAVLHQAQQDVALKAQLDAILSGFLTRDEDKELFGLSGHINER